MRVKRLKMQSFRGIGDLTLEFPPDEPTVFIGINGVGKSTILDCIAILLSRLVVGVLFDSRSRNFLSKKNLLTSKIVGLRQQDLVDERSFSQEDIKNNCPYTENEISILLNSKKITWSLATNQKEQSTNIGNNLDDLQGLTNDIRHHLSSNPKFNLPLAVHYPVNRTVIDINLEIPDEPLFKQGDAYDEALAGVKISFESFFQWFRKLEDLENEELRDDSSYQNRQLEAVREAIYNLIDGFSNLRVRRSPLRMTVKKQGQEFIVNQLSDGEKCLLAMVGDLARRLAIANPDLDNPLEGAGVILIDEIELHLHPEWQRKIMPTFTRTFPNCQFIVTTHSPQVLSQVKPESIFILERTDEGQIVATHPESSFGRDSNRILEDLMGVSERPQEIKNRLLELFRLIDKGDIEGARQLRQELADEIGYDEPEFVRADVLIRRKEILNK